MSTTRSDAGSIRPRRPQHHIGAAGSLAVGLLLLTSACDRGSEQTVPAPYVGTVPPVAQSGGYGDEHRIPLPEADQRLCTAVVILLDTSGSMNESVPDLTGTKQPKHQIARTALDRIVDYTEQWQQSHPDRMIQLGVLPFSSSTRPVLPMGEFKAQQARAALASIPGAAGGTAIGDALAKGFQALYQSGCVRKYLVCITDGQNTVGPPPDRVARQLYDQTRGEVEVHFVAFDTSAAYFSFLASVNGYTVQANDGAQLAGRLAEIYEKRILAEAMPAEKQE
jgi:hypothetical protein